MTPEERAKLFADIRGKYITAPAAPAAPAPKPASPPASRPAARPKPKPLGNLDPQTAGVIAALPPEFGAAFDMILRKPSGAPTPGGVMKELGANLQVQEEANNIERADPTPRPEAPVTAGPASPGQLVPLEPEWIETLKQLAESGEAQASVFGSEPGTQEREDLRLMPMQKLNAEYGLSPQATEDALTTYYFRRAQVRGNLPSLQNMDPEQYKQLLEASRNEAHRKVAGAVGQSESKGNLLVPLKTVDERVKQAQRGEGMAAPLYATPWGAVVGGAHLRELLGGAKVEDQAIMQLMAPLYAMAQPGQVAAEQTMEDLVTGGQPVRQEGKFGWLTRLALSTPILSWAWDQDLEYSLGGEKGIGGTKHIEKIVRGYDIIKDLPKLEDAYEKYVLPNPALRAAVWAAQPGLAVANQLGVESKIAAMIPAFGIIMAEPDAISLGSGLVAAPLSKGAKLVGAGVAIMGESYLPIMRSWREALEAGKTFDEIAATVGPAGTPKWILFQGYKADTQLRAKDAGMDVSKAPNLADFSGLKIVQKEALEASKDAERAVMEAEETLKVADEALVNARAEAARNTTMKLDDAAHDVINAEDAAAANLRRAEAAVETAKAELAALEAAGLRELSPLLQKATDASRTHRSIEQEMVTAMVLRGVENARTGDRITDIKTGAELEFVGLRAGGRNVVAQAKDGTEVVLPISQVSRFGDPAGDTPRVLEELTRLKKVRADIAAQTKLAKARGDKAAVLRLERQWMATSGRLIMNSADVDAAALVSKWRKSRKVLGDTVNDLVGARAKLARKVPVGDPPAPVAKALAKQAGVAEAGRVMKADALDAMSAAKASAQAGGLKLIGRAREAVDRVLPKLTEAMDLRTAAFRHQDALDGLSDTGIQVARDWETALQQTIANINRGTQGRTELGKSVLQGLAKLQKGGRHTFDGARYYAELVSRYGTDVVQKVLDEPTGRPFRGFLTGRHDVGPEGFAQLRKFEEALHAAGETSRLEPTALVSGVMGALAMSPSRWPGLTKEGWLAWGYQVGQRLARARDRVGAGIIGRHAPLVQGILRRSYGRLHASTLELDKVAGDGGIAGMRQFLTSATDTFGTVSNRDTMTHADKMLAYLRALAEGDPALWTKDMVVKALSSASLPGWFVGSVPTGEAMGALRAAILRPDQTGAALVKLMEELGPALFTKELGKADAPQVAFRFIARAVLQASNQHDAMWDLMRMTGPGIDAASANSLNFMIERGLKQLSVKGEMSAAKAAQVAQTFGLPYLSKMPGHVTSVFNANEEAVKLLHAGTLAGKGIWLPETVLRALNEVPFKLSKELTEFPSPTNPYLEGFLKYARLWRIATVNGFVAPRAAHFTNTFFGDWSQMVQAVGWVPGTRLALQSLPTYVPFVGRALQDKLLQAGAKNSMVGAMFDPHLAAVFRGGDDTIIETFEGPVTGRRLLDEGHVDGCWDSISTQDLMDATARATGGFWSKIGIDKPLPWVQKSAKMMEEIQRRNRLALYTHLRTSGMPREAARARLNEALYDWNTGIGEWEMNSIARIAAFWTYRRGSMRQLGASLTESFTTPTAEYWSKALTGRTKIARMRQMSVLVGGMPEALYWEDPHAELDDTAQLDAYARLEAPWWVKAQGLLGNRQVSGQRKLWHSEVAGRDVTYEALILPALTTLDHVYMMNLFIQTTMASTVMLAEAAGLRPAMTTVGAAQVWERNVDEFSDTLMPGFDSATSNVLRGLVGEQKYKDKRKGVKVSQAQAILLHRLGWSDFMAVAPDEEGHLRVDPGVYGMVTQLFLGMPVVADISRNWAIFDNPGLQSSIELGLAEALARYAGFKPQGHDPAKSRDYEVGDQERRLKDAVNAAKKQGGSPPR